MDDFTSATISILSPILKLMWTKLEKYVVEKVINI